MIILGIDPSYSVTGVAVIECHGIPGQERVIATGVVKVPTSLTDRERCREIALACAKWAARWGAEAVGIEGQYTAPHNYSVGLRLAALRSAVEQRLRDTYAEDRIVAVTPGERAEALGLRGRLKREEVKRRVVAAVRLRYGVAVSDDEADAIGIALAAGRKIRRGEKAEQLQMALPSRRRAKARL